MSRQLYKSASQTTFFVLRGVGLSVGVAMLLSGGSAIALTASPNQLLAQRVDTSADVVVDTDSGSGSTTGSNRQTANGTRFTCEFVNGQPTVMYHPETQAGQSYSWATPSSLGGGWTPQRRCTEISRRLESYRPDGLLEMQTSVQNGYNTVCVTTERVGGCRIVFTVPPGQDPIATRDSVFQNLTVADSGQTTQGVYTYRGGGTDQVLNDLLNLGRSSRGASLRGSQNINLRPFLDKRDGGTATQLRGGIRRSAPARSNPRLNPGSFR